MEPWRDMTLDEVLSEAQGGLKEGTKAVLTLAQAAEELVNQAETIGSEVVLPIGLLEILRTFVEDVDEALDEIDDDDKDDDFPF